MVPVLPLRTERSVLWQRHNPTPHGPGSLVCPSKGKQETVAIRITLPDGSERGYESGATGFDIANDIGHRLKKAKNKMTMDGAIYDLHREITSDAAVSVVTDNTEAGRHVARHSAAHIMAQAVLDLYPGAAFAVGPAIDDGFYYDFQVEHPFTPEDLERIEERMRSIVAADQAFERGELPISEALEAFLDQPFKVEIIEGVDAEEGVEYDTVST